MNAIGGLPQLSNNSVQTLLSLAKEFENIADTCLLVLHIEVSKELHPIALTRLTE